MERSRSGGYVVSHPAKWDWAAMSSVRPADVAGGLPEHVEPAAPLLMFTSLAAAVGGSQGHVAGSGRWVKIAKQVGPLRQVDPMGEEIRVAVLFL